MSFVMPTSSDPGGESTLTVASGRHPSQRAQSEVARRPPTSCVPACEIPVRHGLRRAGIMAAMSPDRVLRVGAVAMVCGCCCRMSC